MERDAAMASPEQLKSTAPLYVSVEFTEWICSLQDAHRCKYELTF